MAKLNCEIVTPSSKVWTGEAYMVSVPGLAGSLGFLPGHVGLVTPLGKGKVSVSNTDKSDDSSAKHFNIEGGYVQVFDDNVVVLAEHVE